MADDEQFSLCWNNFNTNLSAGFHESLCRGDLVDVTLAAEGQFVKAHRLVLSVCSPYFRKMFTTMPANQHAFVFLKDVSHSALKDLIQFMYCGEVNVKQDALPAFISTAEALQIKGLTDGDPAPAQSPTKHSTPAQQTATRVRQSSTTRPQPTATSRSYKIETIDDSGDEVLVSGKTTTQIVLQTTAPPTQTTPQQSQNLVQTNQGTTVVSQKRPAGQRSISSAQAKRIKTQTVVSVQQNDPLESVGATETTTLQAVQSVSSAADKSDSEFIDLPIDLPTKSEPDYSNTDDAVEVDQAGEQEGYVEDDSYGDMKYDESYFTENEDHTATGAAATSVTATSTPAIKQQFGEASYTETGDQSGAEAQGKTSEKPTTTKRRGRKPKNTTGQKATAKEKLEELYARAVRQKSVPAMYVSTTRGSMKLNYGGHHFYFKYKRGPYTLFNCCFKENGEECKVRVIVCNQRVYHLDGEHVHFRQAVDKSATSVAFEVDTVEDAGEENKEADDIAQKIFNDLEKDDSALGSSSASSKQPVKILNSQAVAKPLKSSPQGVKQEQMDPEDFKEKIKRRLQNALLKKK